MSSPTVSIILPTYNRGRLLRQALASVVGQSFVDWELLVADDGSTDETRSYLENLVDDRIRPLLLAHSGKPGTVRAAALKSARAEWVAFLDSDDIWLPDKLHVQLAHHARHPECGWSYTAYRVVDLTGATVPLRPPGPYPALSGRILEQLLTFEVSAAMQTVLARRSLIDEVGGFDETIYLRGDYDLVLRLAARADACAIPEELTLIREHGGRTTSAMRRATLFRESERVFRKMSRQADSQRIRALCRRQCAAHLARMAYELSVESHHKDAMRAAGAAIGASPLSAVGWRSAVGTVLRRLGVRRTSTVSSQSRSATSSA